MSKKSLKIIIFLLAPFLGGVFFLIPQSPTVAQEQKKDIKYVPGEVIVKLRTGANIAQSLGRIKSKVKEAKAEKIFKDKDRGDLSRIFKVEFSPDQNIEEIVGEYQKDPSLEWAEPNYIREIAVTNPNDPKFQDGTQWGLNKIKAPEAWDIQKGSDSIRIAVVDTGVDWDHPDLQSNIWQDGSGNYGYDTVDANLSYWENLDNDSDGVGDFRAILGEDYANIDYNPMDFHGHGTHVAGILGAVTDNSTGMAGTAWYCEIMAMRAGFAIEYDSLNGPGQNWVRVGMLEDDDSAAAITYAADNGASVINMSWGSYSSSSTIEAAINYAYLKGCVLIGAAGNNNSEGVFYPAGYSNVLAVAATDSNDQKASFSNYGPWVDVSAPGTGIYSTDLDNTYGSGSGTSYAAPFVAGQAGVLRSQYPSWSASQTSSEIKNTTDNIDTQNPSYIGKLGTGRINLERSIVDIGSIIKLSSFSISPQNPAVGEQVTATFSFKNESSSDITLDFARATSRNIYSPYDAAPFDLRSSILVPAGGDTGPIQVTRSFTRDSTYKFWVYFYYNEKGYVPSNESGVSSPKYLNLLPITSKIKLSSLSLSPSNPAVGEQVTATFSFSSTMVSDITLDFARATSRNIYSPYDAAPFDLRSSILVPAGGDTGPIQVTRSFTRDSTYKFWVYFYYNGKGYVPSGVGGVVNAINIVVYTGVSSIDWVSPVDGFTYTLNVPSTSGGIGREQHLCVNNPPESEAAHYSITMTPLDCQNGMAYQSGGSYWGAFAKPADSSNGTIPAWRNEVYYCNMRWGYITYAEKECYFQRKVIITNKSNGKKVICAILDYGPAEWTGLVAGASPEALKAIGATHRTDCTYYFLKDQDSLPVGPLN